MPPAQRARWEGCAKIPPEGSAGTQTPRPRFMGSGGRPARDAPRRGRAAAPRLVGVLFGPRGDAWSALAAGSSRRASGTDRSLFRAVLKIGCRHHHHNSERLANAPVSMALSTLMLERHLCLLHAGIISIKEVCRGCNSRADSRNHSRRGLSTDRCLMERVLPGSGRDCALFDR